MEKNRLNQTTKNAKIKCAESICCCDEEEWKITQPIEFAPIHFVAKKKRTESLCVDILQLKEIGLGLARR